MIAVNQPSILVIEDDKAVQQTLVDILELNGYLATSASNGAEGLELARRDIPALIITDIEMPRLTGYEIIQHLRRNERTRTIPVIVISAKVDRVAMRKGMELGADDFITKPFSEDEVIRSIRTRLEKKELLDELDAFAHTVAHDLKNPLATLIGRLDILLMTLDTADEATKRKHVSEACNSATRLVSIIDELLVLSGVRQKDTKPEPLDMTAIVTEAMERLRDLLIKTKANVQLPETWPTASGYAPWIVHVWTNYISNAAKYAGPNAQIRLGAMASADRGRIRFTVSDDGPGLGSAAVSALFVPFTRITNVRANGHGLGLSIVRRIIEKLGGQVGVDSEPDRGACFWFELPTADSIIMRIPS